MEECLSTIPGLFVQRVDTGQLHFSKLISWENSTIDQKPFMVIWFILPSCILEFLGVQASIGVGADIHLVKLRVARHDDPDHWIILLWVIFVRVVGQDVHLHFVSFLFALRLSISSQVCHRRFGVEVARSCSHILLVLIILSRDFTSDWIWVSLESDWFSNLSKFQFLAGTNSIHF